jgi:hypothetical protein
MSAWLFVNPIAARTVGFVLGAALLALTVRGLKRESAQLVHRFVSRERNPPLYWTMIGVAGVVGAYLVLGAVFPKLEGF